jgi:hypothetical protein
MIAFQCCPEGQDELFSIFCPWRKLDISNIGPALFLPKIDVGYISEKSWQIIKLWRALFDIR